MRRLLGRVALLATLAFTTGAVIVSTAAADWNPLAPITSPTLDAGAITSAFNADGSAAAVWVADGGPMTLQRYSADGQALDWSFTVDYTSPTGEINSVGSMVVDGPNHILYIADSDNRRIVSFDVDGSATPLNQTPDGVITECPGSGCPVAGSAPGQFEWLGDIGLHGGEVFAVDGDNARIQVFNAQLEYLRSISRPDWEAPIPDVSNGFTPDSMAINPANGNLLIGMSDGQTIQEVASDGTLVRSFQHSDGWAWELAIDAENNVFYVASGGSIYAHDYISGERIATVVNYEDSYSWAGVNGLAVQPLERVLLDSYTYDLGGENFASDIIDRFGYDAAPTCSPASIDAVFQTATQVSLSCTDTSTSPQITYELVGQPAHGTISNFNAATGSLTYEPATGYSGSDTFSYRAHSLTGASTAYSAQITVGEGPVVRKSVNLVPLSPGVLIKLPGTNEWIRLEEATLIPIGTIIDARVGKAELTLANADGSTYTGQFWGGVFQVLQGSGSNPIATLKLRDDIAGASTAVYRSGDPFRDAMAARSRGKKRNGLWGKGKGKFRTTGRGGSATVRGTTWWVSNYANGTAFKVTSGVVKVTPLHCPAFNLKAGRSAFIFFENQNKIKFIGKRKRPLIRNCKFT